MITERENMVSIKNVREALQSGKDEMIPNRRDSYVLSQDTRRRAYLENQGVMFDLNEQIQQFSNDIRRQTEHIEKLRKDLAEAKLLQGELQIILDYYAEAVL